MYAELLENVKLPDSVIFDAIAIIAEILFPVNIHLLKFRVESYKAMTAGCEVTSPLLEKNMFTVIIVS